MPQQSVYISPGLQARLERLRGTGVRVNVSGLLGSALEEVLFIVEQGTQRPANPRPAPTLADGMVGTSITDRHGNYTSVNDAFVELLGAQDRREVIGSSYRDWTHPSDMEESDAQLHRMTTGSISTFRKEKRYVRQRDGLPVRALIDTTTVCEGRELVGAMHIIRKHLTLPWLTRDRIVEGLDAPAR